MLYASRFVTSEPLSKWVPKTMREMNNARAMSQMIRSSCRHPLHTSLVRAQSRPCSSFPGPCFLGDLFSRKYQYRSQTDFPTSLCKQYPDTIHRLSTYATMQDLNGRLEHIWSVSGTDDHCTRIFDTASSEDSMDHRRDHKTESFDNRLLAHMLQ